MLPWILPLPKWLIDCTIQGSIGIAFLLIIAPMARRVLGARAVSLLWALVIFRMLVPWHPELPFRWDAPGVVVNDIASSVTSGLKIRVSRAETADVTRESRKAEPAAGEAPPVALVVWIAGMAVIAGFSVFQSLRASRIARRARDISDEPLLGRILDSVDGVPERLRIRETGVLRSPALAGLVRPMILLPADWRERLSPEQLRYVLLHEMGHHRHRDLVWRWIFLAARTIHWFNPLVWLAGRAAHASQEMACDEWVLRHDASSNPGSYGEALLVWLESLAVPGMDSRFRPTWPNRGAASGGASFI